jgi:hypothetical protein
MIRGFSQLKQHLTLALVVVALAVRVLVPAGWMPATALGHATFTLCTGTGMVEAWVGDDGTIHKSVPDKGGKGSIPCLFAGLGAGIDPGSLIKSISLAPVAFVAASLTAFAIAIGHGLAAPPPPSTGPPH